MLKVREILREYQIDIELGGSVGFLSQPSNSLHRHNFFEVCYVVGGHGEYLHNRLRYSLSPGDVFASEPNILHEISSYGAQNLEIFFIRFSAVRLDWVEDDHCNNAFILFLRGHRIHSPSDGLMGNFVALLKSKQTQSPRLLSLFAFELLSLLAAEPATRVEEVSAGEFDALFTFVDENIERRITVNECAVSMGTSERTLRRRFKIATGTTLSAEINHRRMRMAAHWLLDGRTVREVSDKLDGMDPAQFHRNFSRVFAMSPKKFQKTYVPGSVHHSTRP